ncbi:hypothetical protein PIIN_11526 [Serendipita indica DSM 11827]|uniref:Uncharacterized protein n=1 Tax=Serendipita indica (strain DSM 11827) TaxID=1109443 RepID=G4U1V6_SERID|nr:hypothetical protein PIIN_11526 [Serendipita indica DSM 11827]
MSPYIFSVLDNDAFHSTTFLMRSSGTNGRTFIAIISVFMIMDTFAYEPEKDIHSVETPYGPLISTQRRATVNWEKASRLSHIFSIAALICTTSFNAFVVDV